MDAATIITALSYMAAAMVLYYLAFFALSLWTNRRSQKDGLVTATRFVIVVPAHDEELVIDQTVRHLQQLEDVPFLALIMNDGSRDATGDVARAAAAGDERIVVVDRPAEVAGQGKGAVLNDAYRTVSRMVADGDPRLDATDAADVVLCVVDADGWLEPQALREVAPYFREADVAGVQLPVRMWNGAETFLTLMQDVEFLGFCRLLQAGRDVLGSVGLGGNGQFVRLSALQEMGVSPWTRCLTEDLDLTMALIAKGWRLRFCPRACVAQQALTRPRPLLRQRVRWIQGHYTCWQHIVPVLRASNVPLLRRLDAAGYLVGVVFVLIFAALVAISLGTYTGLLEVHPTTFGFIASESVYSLVILGLTVVPVACLALTYKNAASTQVPFWALPGVFLVFTVYGYLWAVPATVLALTRIALRRDRWVKTPRVAVSPAALARERSALTQISAAG